MLKKYSRLIFSALLVFLVAQSSIAANRVELSTSYFPNPDKSRSLPFAQIYVGIIDLDPEIPANQKQISVLQESGAVTPVPQPLLTNAGGVPVYNDSPVSILVDGSYSLKVLDKGGSQVYYIPNTDAYVNNEDFVELSETVDTKVTKIDTIADLRTYTGYTGESVQVLGYYTNGDGGGGPIRVWKTGGSYTDNGGSVITPSGVPGPDAWVWEYSGPYNILHFGASPAQTPAINTPSIQACLDTGKTIYIPIGTFGINDELHIKTRDQIVYGDGLNSTINQTADNTNGFVIDNGTAAGVQISNMLITATGTTAGGSGIRSEYTGDMRFDKVVVTEFFNGFYIDTRTFVSTSDVTLTGCKAFSCTNAGFWIYNGTQIYLERCDALSNGKGFLVEIGSACHFTDCLSLSSTIHGFQIIGPTDWVWADKMECDNSGINGINVADVRGLFMSDSWSGSSGADGVVFQNTKQAQITNTISRFSEGHGWVLSGLSDSILSNCSAIENNRDVTTDRAGFLIGTGASSLSLNNCDASDYDGNRQKFGFQIAGTSTDIQIIGGRAKGNIGSNIVNTTSGITKIENIDGYKTYNTGNDSLPGGQTTVTIPHGLDITPDIIKVTLTSSAQGKNWFVNTITASSFNFNVDVAAGGAIDFRWDAGD